MIGLIRNQYGRYGNSLSCVKVKYESECFRIDIGVRYVCLVPLAFQGMHGYSDEWDGGK